MAKQDWKSIETKILELIGGKANVKTVTNCQTRLRINVFDLDLVNQTEIKKVEGTLGLNITGQQVQIIYGPGKVSLAAEAFEKVSGIKRGSEVAASLEEIAAEEKAKAKAKNTSAFQKFIGKFAGIFAPLIVGFIGAGILAGIAGIIQSSYSGKVMPDAATSWMNVFNVLMDIWKATFLVIVGWRTAEAFGGSGVHGAIIAGLYVTLAAASVDKIFVPHKDAASHIDYYTFLGGKILDPVRNWFTVGLRPGDAGVNGLGSLSYPSGSIFGVMFSAGIVGLIEKGYRKFVPSVVDTVVTPTLVLITLLALNFALIIPVSGYVFTAVSFMFKNLYGNPFGTALLAGMFLITVVFGIHQGFVPVYAAIMADTKAEGAVPAAGVNGLFPVLALAGAAQVGMAIALWMRAEAGSTIRKQIQGAIIPGFLGIGEPLIYGVSLPRVKPFITSCIGGAIAGFAMGAWNLWGGDMVGLNAMFGPSGLLAVPLMTTFKGLIWKGILVYLSGLVIAYAGGFVMTYYFGYKGVDLA